MRLRQSPNKEGSVSGVTMRVRTQQTTRGVPQAAEEAAHATVILLLLLDDAVHLRGGEGGRGWVGGGHGGGRGGAEEEGAEVDGALVATDLVGGEVWLADLKAGPRGCVGEEAM